MGLATESQFHVLAVDDSLIDRKVIERLLRTSSYQVTTVDSGSKALEFLGLNENDQNEPNRPSVSPNSHREIEVNLIITDYCMPGMTGYDLLKKIKESSFRNIPVVIMSSENVQSRITRCLEEGAEEFFLKPVRASDLHKIKTHMMKTKMQNQKQECQQKLGGSEIPSFVLQENQLKLPQLVSQELHHQPLVSLELQHQSLVSQEMQHLLASQGLQEQCAVSHKPQEQQPSTLQEPQGQQLKQPMLQEILEQQLQQPFLQEQLDTHHQLMIEEQQKQSLSQSNNNKRKSMEEGLSPDCTRPRHDGIVTTV